MKRIALVLSVIALFAIPCTIDYFAECYKQLDEYRWIKEKQGYLNATGQELEEKDNEKLENTWKGVKYLHEKIEL